MKWNWKWSCDGNRSCVLNHVMSSCYSPSFGQTRNWILRRPITWKLLLARATAQCSVKKLGQFFKPRYVFVRFSRIQRRDVARIVSSGSPSRNTLQFNGAVKLKILGLVMGSHYRRVTRPQWGHAKNLQSSHCVFHTQFWTKNHRAPSCRLPHAGLHLI